MVFVLLTRADAGRGS